MFISGSIGVSIYKNEDKIIVLLADDHSNKIYCNSVIKDIEKNEHLDIKKYLKKSIGDGDQILLEEVPRDNFDLEELWPDSPHTQDLKNLFLSEDKITGIDIRPYLIPFSWEIVYDNVKLSKITIDEYLQNLKDFFNFKGDFYEKVFHPTIKEVKIDNKGLGKNLQNLKLKFIKLIESIKNKDTPLIYFINNDQKILDEISGLCDDIMEFNTLLTCFTNKKKSIIHTGLYHSNNINNLLLNLYNFKVIYNNGVNKFPPSEKKSDITSCVYLPGIDNFGFVSPKTY